MDINAGSDLLIELEQLNKKDYQSSEYSGSFILQNEFNTLDYISTFDALKNLSLWSIPNIFIILINNIIPFLNVLFIGISGDSNALVSWGLGAITLNIIFDSVDWGLMTGVDTLVSQAFGRKDLNAWELYLNIWRYLLLLLMIPQGLIVFFEDDILILFGQQPENSMQARYYLIYIFPGYVFMMMFIWMRRYLNWCGLNRPLLFITGTTLVIHLIFLYFTVIYFRLGLNVVGAWTSISFCFQYISIEIFTYSRKEREHQAKWIWINKEMIDKLPSYLKFGVPGLVANFFSNVSIWNSSNICRVDWRVRDCFKCDFKQYVFHHFSYSVQCFNIFNCYGW